MTSKHVLFLVLVSVAPSLIALAFALRREAGAGQRRMYLVGLTLGCAVLLSFAALFLLRFISTKTNVSLTPQAGTDPLAAAYSFLVVEPLGQGLTALAILPGLRSRAHQTPYDTMRISAASAIGFSAVQIGALVLALDPTFTNLLAAVEATLAHVVFTSMWGYAVGRTGRRRLSGAWFVRAFVIATVFTGVIDHLLFARGPGALVATTPLVVFTGIMSLVARRDLRQMSRLPTRKRSRLLRVEPPSLDQIRKALRSNTRPVAIRWVGFGALVTTGVMVTAVALGVYVGRRSGIDFAAVDRGSSEGAVSALLLLGTAVLAAFPVSGFLLARASAAQGVLEPALGAACAIAAIVVMLGLAAPVAVVFALAFAPVAFALACVGAWVGAER